MVMVFVVSMVMLNILVVVLMVMPMVQYPDRKSHFAALGVPGMDEEALVSIMNNNLSLYLEGGKKKNTQKRPTC